MHVIVNPKNNLGYAKIFLWTILPKNANNKLDTEQRIKALMKTINISLNMVY